MKKFLFTVLLLHVMEVSIAQNVFFDKLFGGFPSDSVVQVFKKTKSSKDAHFMDASLLKLPWLDTNFVSSKIMIYIKGFEERDTVKKYKCITDIELSYEQDSVLSKSLNHMENLVQLIGKPTSIAFLGNATNKSYVIHGRVYKLKETFVLGKKTFSKSNITASDSTDKEKVLIIRKVILIE